MKKGTNGRGRCPFHLTLPRLGVEAVHYDNGWGLWIILGAVILWIAGESK